VNFNLNETSNDAVLLLRRKVVKFHQLQIIKNTVMERQYRRQPEDFRFFNLDEYIDLVIDFLELLNPAIVVERFAGEVPPRFITGPHWGSLRYDQILNAIVKRLLQRNTWQGRALESLSKWRYF
jgi:radical SAM superfamily enzyme